MFNRNYNPITGNRFFAGESDQEAAGKAFHAKAGKIDPNVKNRWDSHKSPFDYGKIESKLDDTFGGYEDIINRDTAEAVAKQQSGAASSMASRGITGGSALTDTQSGIASDINKTKTNALSKLGVGKSSQLGDLMKYFNQMAFAQTGQAQGVDQQNMQNLFQKFGIEGGSIGMLDDDTWLDDVFGGMNAAGNLAQGVGSFFG